MTLHTLRRNSRKSTADQPGDVGRVVAFALTSRDHDELVRSRQRAIRGIVLDLQHHGDAA